MLTIFVMTQVSLNNNCRPKAAKDTSLFANFGYLLEAITFVTRKQPIEPAVLR